jgi:hypothetical protein
VIALVQPALTVPLTVWLGGTWWAHATLAIGFVLMGAYNVWGKRCPFPPLTDAIQGIAWGTLAIYAAQALGAEPNALTWMVAAYVVGYTLLFNGIHGPLRDLATDFASGARTTAIFLGARPAPDGGDPGVPRAVAVFAYGVLAGLIGLHVALLVRNDFGYEAVTWIATTIAVAAVDVVIILLHPRVVRPRGPVWEVAYRLQLYLVMMSLPVAFFAHISAGVLLALLLLTVISLPLFEWTPNIARWTWLTIRSAVWPASGKRPTLRTPTD